MLNDQKKRIVKKCLGACLSFALVAVLCGSMAQPVFATEVPAQPEAVEEQAGSNDLADDVLNSDAAEVIEVPEAVSESDEQTVDEPAADEPVVDDAVADTTEEAAPAEDSAQDTTTVTVADPIPAMNTGGESESSEEGGAEEESTPQPVLGFVDQDGSTYYYYEDGKYYSKKMFSVNGKKYYANSDGHIVHGIFKYKGEYYYANAKGAIKTTRGAFTYKGKNYYTKNANGVLYQDQLITAKNGYKYYAGSYAVLKTGVFKYNDKLYYANPSYKGRIKTKAGLVTWKNKKYYAKSGGQLYQNQLITVNAKTKYYAGKNGVLKTGVLKIGDNYVYADPKDNGKFRTKAGLVTWKGKKYCCDGKGTLYRNQLLSFGGTTRYYAGNNAAMKTGVLKIGNDYVYADPNDGGKFKTTTGWVTWNGKKYFADGKGTLYKNQIISFGSTRYYLESDAAVAHGLIKVGQRFYRADATTGVLSDVGEGWIKYQNKSYYVASNGLALTNTWKKIGSKWYHFNSSSYCDKEQSTAPLDAMGQKAQSYSSNTSYLILVSRDDHRVSIYSGSIWNWTPVKSFSCGDGKSSTPTITGSFNIPSKYPRSQPYFDSGSARCWYPTRIHGGYLFHSVLYYQSGSPSSIMDGRLGVGVSHGCVRLALENAKWIYDNIPIGTKVVIY